MLPVPDATYIASARREVEGLARTIGLPDDDKARAALVTTELATNLARHAKGGDLKLCNILPSVRTLFELVRMHRLFHIFDTPEAAIRAFQL